MAAAAASVPAASLTARKAAAALIGKQCAGRTEIVAATRRALRLRGDAAGRPSSRNVDRDASERHLAFVGTLVPGKAHTPLMSGFNGKLDHKQEYEEAESADLVHPAV